MASPPPTKMNLKTLKDIEKEREKIHEQCFECCEDYEPIKQEVIKWIKELINEQKLFFEEDYTKTKSYDWETYRGEDIVAWIKHFFNITEEEVDESPPVK